MLKIILKKQKKTEIKLKTNHIIKNQSQTTSRVYEEEKAKYLTQQVGGTARSTSLKKKL